MAKQRRSEDDFARDLKERRLTRAQEFTREGGGHVAFSKFGGRADCSTAPMIFLQRDGRRRATTLKVAAAQRPAKKAKAIPAKQAKPTTAELDVARRKDIADRKI